MAYLFWETFSLILMLKYYCTSNLIIFIVYLASINIVEIMVQPLEGSAYMCSGFNGIYNIMLLFKF